MGRPKGSIPPNRIDIKGQRFGRLVVVEEAGRTPSGNIRWRCACDCGGEVFTVTAILRKGRSRSCGCLSVELVNARNRTHGLYFGGQHPLYDTYRHMRNRCGDPGHKDFNLYGGRGIKVCDRWLNGDGVRIGFECFVADMAPKPSPSHTLDRHPDNDGNYEPGNCRWATPVEQRHNQRRYIAAHGEHRP
ncbi:hypothetical protein EN802_13750 [bacterium M00.F.Ca.ET.159.01.1.1]|nr:hypothetical protein EN802_13750 [bacterium M00.F.Ca.ET.159.01.1.1]